MERQVRAVTFDLGNTLVLQRTAEEQSLLRDARCMGMLGVLRRFGSSPPRSVIQKGYDECALLFRASWEKNREVTTEDQVRHSLTEALGQDRMELLGDARVMMELVEAYNSPALETPPTLNGDARQVIEEMRRQNLRLGIISNTHRTSGHARRLLMKKLGLAEHFSAEVYSDEIGWRKPDPRIFAEASAKLETPPPNMLHIGDSLIEDVWGAKRAHMQALHYTNPRQPPGQENAGPAPVTTCPFTAAGPRTISDATINNLREALDYLSRHQ